MPRTVEQWIAATTKSLGHVAEDLREAAARQLVRGVQELQRAAPRRLGPRLRRVGAGASLFRSIKMDRKALGVYTDHPGANLLEEGGTVRPLRGQWLTIPLRRTYLAGGRQFFALPERNGARVVLERGRRRGGPVALLLRRVTVRGTRWISRGVREAEQGADERIASHVLRDEQGGG